MLLTEPPLNPRSNRDTAAQILFETFNVPALYTSIQAVLSLYASGRTTGVVLDAGDGVSHAVPVYQGFTVPNSIRRIDVAGRDVTEYLQTLLRKSGYVFHTSAEKEVVRLIKEAVTYVAKDPRKEEKEWAAAKMDQARTAEYVLPDGNKLKVCSTLGPDTMFWLLNFPGYRLAQNGSVHQKSSSTPKSSASSTPACTKSWSTRSTGLTSTCGKTCTPTSCSQAAAP